MRRVFPFLLAIPVLASCSDSPTPVSPAASALHSEAPAHTEADWPAEENWFTPEGVLEVVEESPLQGSPTSGEVMQFGNADAGQIFPGPPGSHDASWHGRDRIIPGTVVINAGQTVTFKIVFGHRVGIYNDGVMPEDIQRTPGDLLLYPVGRVFLQPAPIPQFTLKFVRPGKYLVLCAINKHFFDANQWGWIIVR